MFSVRSALVALASLALVAASPVEERQSAAGPHAGRASFYVPGLGVCGKFSQSSDFVTAVSPEVFDAFPGSTPGQTFGKSVPLFAWLEYIGTLLTDLLPSQPYLREASYRNLKGKSIAVSILDSCPTCGFNDIDLSSGAFKALTGDLNVGIIDVTWKINGI